MKEDAKTPEAFDQWLKQGIDRSPSLYKRVSILTEPGFVGSKADTDEIRVPGGDTGNVVTPKPVVKPGSKPWSDRERIDWQSKAAGEEVEWDGREE